MCPTQRVSTVGTSFGALVHRDPGEGVGVRQMFVERTTTEHAPYTPASFPRALSHRKTRAVPCSRANVAHNAILDTARMARKRSMTASVRDAAVRWRRRAYGSRSSSGRVRCPGAIGASSSIPM